MRIVVDTNIVFSALLNTNSKISHILLQPKTRLNFYSTEQLKSELTEHQDKLLKISGYTEPELDRLKSILFQKIRFINHNLIPLSIFEKSEKLAKDVDIDDCEFVALTEHIKGRLWTGDKKLTLGLQEKKWKNVVTTNELYNLIMKK